MLNTENDIKNIVNNNTDYYERCLLSTIINNSSFWLDRCRQNINTKASKFENFRDFSKPIDNDLYNACCVFYSAMTSGINDRMLEQVKKLDVNSILGSLKASKKDYDADEYFETAKRRLELIESETPYSEATQSIADKCFDYWLEVKRSKYIASKVLSNPTGIQDLLDTIKSASDKIVKKKSSATKDIMTILDCYNNAELDDIWERIPIASLPKLTEVMGGGIKKQETMLIIAPPAGGKTTMSCQIAASLAENKTKVLYITTEQPAAELLPKIVSCGAMIGYEKIKDGIKGEYLDPDNPTSPLSKSEIKRFKDFIQRIKENLLFEEWCSDGSKIKAHLNSTIEQHLKEHGVDVVIIDWLGGGVDMEASRGDLKRHFLDECCRIIKDAAIKYNVAILYCSQASQAKSEDVRFITAAEISEHTQMHVYATTALGISALGVSKKNQKGTLNGEVENKKTTQYFNLFKTRKSRGKAWAVHTNFDFSRFEEINGDPIVNQDLANQPMAKKIEHDVTLI